LNDAYRMQAERLAELVLEQLERIELTEHEEACILTAIAQQLVRRLVELGEVVESESLDLDDHSALQMATAIGSLGPAVEGLLERIASDSRFGLLPTRGPRALRPTAKRTSGRDDGMPRPGNDGGTVRWRPRSARDAR
jgi:hypothetical protein